MAVFPSDLCSGHRISTTSSYFFNRSHSHSATWLASSSMAFNRLRSPPVMRLKKKAAAAAALNMVASRMRTAAEKICTADELHHVSVPNSEWRLALWRYLPSPKGPPRNHPLFLLSGVGTNAVGYDLSPESSFARFMSGQGFDTWILELRGAGLSAFGVDFEEDLGSTASPVEGKTSAMLSNNEKAQLVSKLLDNFMNLSERIERFLSGGDKNAALSRIFDLQERLAMKVEDFQRQLDPTLKYDWDFDHYLEEDVPAAMDYVRTHCKPKDGKLLAIGHSMGGILLYSMLSKSAYEGRDAALASVTTLASTLDYTSSRSSLRLLLPLKEPLQTLRVIPIGGLIALAHPFASYPPYALSWLTPQISAPEMMSPELFEKLAMKNFCSVPTKLLVQLSTAFQEGGLCNRNGTFCYKDYIGKSRVPILALAGDQDLICPPEAVYETVKLIPEHLVTYKVLGEPGGPHYAHYDLVGGRMAIDEVYPCIVEFLDRHDRT